MKHPKQTVLRALPALVALVLAAAAQAQSTPAETRPAAEASAPAQAAAAMPQDSSDANVPPATARKQAAEVASGDPQRWYREDTTPAQRLRTLQKEIAAGLQESQGNCRRQPTAERAACLKQARATYQKEMAEARAKAMAEPAR